MKKDRLLIAAVIGGLSTISGEIITKILSLLGMGQYAVFELNSLLLTNDKPSMLMGFIINFVIGCYIASAFYLFFEKFGSQHVVMKSTVGSLMIWFIFELAFTALIEDKYIPIRPVADHYVHIIGTALFGVTMGCFLKQFLYKNGHAAKEQGAARG